MCKSANTHHLSQKLSIHFLSSLSPCCRSYSESSLKPLSAECAMALLHWRNCCHSFPGSLAGLFCRLKAFSPVCWSQGPGLPPSDKMLFFSFLSMHPPGGTLCRLCRIPIKGSPSLPKGSINRGGPCTVCLGNISTTCVFLSLLRL